MKFKGDIIITDPCYIMKENIAKHPKREDYFRYMTIEEYPDAKIPEDVNKEVLEFLKEFDCENELLTSDMYFEDQKKYNTALQEYNNSDDWEKTNYGEYMEAIGIKTYLTSSTIYGDWSCTTYETNTKNKLGNFCADAGMVSVILLDEVLKYNSEFNYHIERPWTTTLIKNFDGEVNIEVINNEVRVIGKGNINFFTTQTGL